LRAAEEASSLSTFIEQRAATSTASLQQQAAASSSTASDPEPPTTPAQRLAQQMREQRRRATAQEANVMAEELTAEFLQALGSPPETRAAAEARIAARRARVDEALQQARAAADELQGLRNSVEQAGAANFNEARERAAMMSLVHAMAVSHQELLSRYQELQMEVAISRVLNEAAVKPPAGVPAAKLEALLPSITYGSVLKGSRAYDLPGDGDCAVCQSSIEPSEVVRLLPCRHCFHSECVDPWFERSTCCPTCRGSVVP
jgi:hypothetical protein